MKLFMLLSSLAVAEAALTPAQEASAKATFNKWDHDHKGDLTSGGVYAALSSLDPKLTETQLQKAAGHNKQKVTLKQFLEIYAKVEGGGNNNGGGKYPKGCKNYFDGCNHCIIKKGKEVGCTEMYCAKTFDAPKKKAFCTVYEDGRRCKSATACTKAKTTYNCYTREVWTAAKNAWCCKNKKMGCSNTKPKTKNPLKAGQVCYAFYESNPGAFVNRKNDCPKGYKCASNPNVVGFNTIMHCVKSSASGGSAATIPDGCTSWYDGCNRCAVQNGKLLGCTKMACFRKGTPRCLQKGGGAVVH